MCSARRLYPCLCRLCLLLGSIPSYAQNQVLGEVQFVSKTKVEKTSGVWIDGQYVGYVGELKDDKKVLLLSGLPIYLPVFSRMLLGLMAQWRSWMRMDGCSPSAPFCLITVRMG
jgi:hypothetical protein